MASRPSHRRSLLAKAHLGQKQMGLDAAEWRVFLRDTTGRDSCRDLDDAALARLVETLAARGVRFTASPRAAGRPSVIDSTSARAKQLGKIEALLTVQKLPWAYAHAIAKRMYQKDRVQLCGKDEMTGIITALNRRRSGLPFDSAQGATGAASTPDPVAG